MRRVNNKQRGCGPINWEISKMRKKETRVWIEFENPRDDHFKDEEFEVVTKRLGKEYTDFYRRLGIENTTVEWRFLKGIGESWVISDVIGFAGTEMDMPGRWFNVNYLASPK
tara:strand:+ start:163 stop:498 length:336 start_codon:yes stop_codon:yes gene_type:complete